MTSRITLFFLFVGIAGPVINALIFLLSILHVINWESAYAVNIPVIKGACIFIGAALLSLLVEVVVCLKSYKRVQCRQYIYRQSFMSSLPVKGFFYKRNEEIILFMLCVYNIFRHLDSNIHFDKQCFNSLKFEESFECHPHQVEKKLTHHLLV